MNIVTTTCVFPPSYPSEIALERLARIGYTYLDLAFDYCTKDDCPFMGERWRSWAEELRAKADELGVRYTHAHACGGAASRDAAILRCFEVCEILGVGYMVIHPEVRKDGKDITDREEFIRINRDAILPLLPYAEKHHVILLSENLLWGASIDPLVIADLVKRVNNPYFGWCFDTGHVHCSGVPVAKLREVSVTPLSLHIQDNHGVGSGDEHALPGDGTIDWKEFLDILKEINYQGDLVLEAHHQSLYAMDAEREGILSELLCRSQKMLAYMNK